MNFYAVSGLIVFISSLSAGLLVLINSPFNKKTITYVLSALSTAGWTGAYVMWQMSTDPVSALFWTRTLMAPCALIPVTQYHFILTLFEDKKLSRRIVLYIFYGVIAVVCLFGFSPLGVKGVEQRLNFPYWPIPGPLTHVFFATLPIPTFATIRLIIEKKNESSPLVQNQLKWVLFAFLIGYFSGCSNCFLWYNIPIRPYPTALTAIMPITMAFLFFKLGLFDIGLFFRRSLLYTLSCLLLGSAGAAVAQVVFKDWRVSLSIMALSFLFKPSFFFVRTHVEKILARTSIWKQSLALRSIDQSVEKIRETTYTYDDLAKNIVASLMETFPVHMAAVYFYDLTRKELHLRAQKGMNSPLASDLRYNRTSLAIPDNDPLMKHMDGKADVVNLEALLEEGRESQIKNQGIMDTLQRIEADICAPFLFQGKVKGMIALGKKINNTIYNAEDVEAIYAFTRMGEDIMRYIMAMETELRNTALYSHDMAHDIRSVIQTLEFMELPMMAGSLPEKPKTLLKQARSVASRVYDLFQLNRDRSQLILRSVRGEYELTPLDLNPVIKTVVDNFSLPVEMSGVRLQSNLSDGPYPILGNQNDLIRVMENLITNGLRYVNTDGQVTVNALKTSSDVLIAVQDDGQGIAQEDLSKIWDIGWQGKEKKGAAGLGLSIVKQIVELHHGSIKVESAGAGRGATFIVSLPLAPS